MGLFSFFKRNKGEQQEPEQAAEVNTYATNSLANVHSFYPEREEVLVKKEKKNEVGYLETTLTDEELKLLVRQAISIFENNPGATPDKIVDKINVYTTDDALALALYRFIPTAYCRLFFPEPGYSDEYIVYKSMDEQDTYHFSADRIYNAVLEESRDILVATSSGDKMLAVVSHSSEFNAINNALNGGSDIKDLVLAPMIFI
ncbi:hypothetical protein ACTHGU_10555 [Chitinophagaceae bacterium MMS25-I14]